MVTLTDNLLSVLGLLGTASFMIVVGLIILNFKFFNSKKNAQMALPAQAIFGVAMGILAVFGTLWGMKLADGTIINVRELAAMIAGVTGGPVGGAIAGVIGGVHRYTVGGATALPCTISTIAIGIVTGLLSTRLGGKWALAKAAVLGLTLESLAMGLIVLLVPQGTEIVDKIAFSMIGANTIGLVLWVYLVNKIPPEAEPKIARKIKRRTLESSVYKREIKRRLNDSLPLKSLSSPVITPHGLLFTKTTGTATVVAYMVSASSATATHNVDCLALPLAH